MSTMNDIISFIHKHESFFITTHLNPDGDALGSALALGEALESMGKKVRIYNHDGTPATYRFLPGHERILEGPPPAEAPRSALILLDCNIPERAGIEELVFADAAVIDHHATEMEFGNPRWVETRNPATGLMVFRLIKELGVLLNPDMAINIYTALAVDTGSFRFPNTTADCLRAAAELVDAGARPGEISEHLYQDWSRDRFELLLQNLSSVELHGQVALTVIPQEMFTETGTTPSDTENFVNFPLVISTVMVSALMREVERDIWRVSLRSKGSVDVSKVAQGFDGGGHMNAAGCTLVGNLQETKERLLSSISSLPEL